MYSCAIDIEDHLVIHHDGDLLCREDYRVRKIDYPRFRNSGKSDSSVSWYVILMDGNLLNITVQDNADHHNPVDVQVLPIQGLELLDIISHDYLGRRLRCVFLLDVNYQLYQYLHLDVPKKVRVKIPYSNLRLHNLDVVAHGEYRLWFSSDDQILTIKVSSELRALLTVYTTIEEIDYIAISTDIYRHQVRIGNSSEEVQILNLDSLSWRPDPDLSGLDFRPTWTSSNGATSYYHDSQAGRRLLICGNRPQFINTPEFREVLISPSSLRNQGSGMAIDYHDNLYQLSRLELTPRLVASGIRSLQNTPRQVSKRISSAMSKIE